ncbi:disulfide bond formation protein DsbB [Rhizomicrobium palustre]|uniref:Disulfide bond formation protein DsbB n=1 Tax=Rhizomicrobium palustre TaxID=189966 RepID=A0A846MX19_9PROT|nr:disulfide bond formation protein B [Rhizomicrobium palustre]NIK88094.1 disulfide bond formation protein DsbB [Rhizomicrobium palustre]
MREDKVAILAGSYSLAMILGALFFQYVLGVLPCEMCHWQRWPHDGAIVAGLGGVILYYTRVIDRDALRLLVWIAIVMILATALIGGYQALVEWKIVAGPESCTGPRFVLSAKMDLNAPVVRCDTPAFRLFGLSLAGFNFLFSTGVALISGLLLTKVIKLPYAWAK